PSAMMEELQELRRFISEDDLALIDRFTEEVGLTQEDFDNYDPEFFSPEKCEERLRTAEATIAQLDTAHQVLAERECVGTAVGGLVSATVTVGGGAVTNVVIDPYVTQRYGVEGLGDMVMAAIRDAQRQTSGVMREVFEEYAPDMLDNPDFVKLLDNDHPGR
ncbi:MAG: YbaB/EbfC family nucleoid-associated protein, partial [Dermatophilaceae bacterium]